MKNITKIMNRIFQGVRVFLTFFKEFYKKICWNYFQELNQNILQKIFQKYCLTIQIQFIQ